MSRGVALRPEAPGVEDDVALVARARDGDRKSFDELYRRHADTLFRRLTVILGPDPEREDLVQEIFWKAFRALEDFRGAAQFGTYLHRAAVNRATDHLRARARRRLDPVEAGQLDALVAPGASPEAAARQRQELARALELLGDLKPKKRVALALHLFEGLSPAAIAELTGAAEAAVRQRIRHASAELAARLAREERR